MSGMPKVLSITCDNASNNDTMVAHMAHLLPSFASEMSRTRCFLHIVNLVAKTLMHQFDT